MPRLTDETYLLNRSRLVDLWNTDERAFVVLNAREQWDLHEYYAITDIMNPEQAIVHRESLTDPSLPQRAGRAMTSLNMKLKAERDKTPRPTPARNSKTRIVLHSVVNPNLDPQEFAKILLLTALEEAKRDVGA